MADSNGKRRLPERFTHWAAHVAEAETAHVTITDDALTVANGDNIVCILHGPVVVTVTDLRSTKDAAPDSEPIDHR